MKSRKYWERRADALNDIHHAMADDTIAVVQKAFDGATSDIISDMNHILETYQGNSGLTQAEAMKLLRTKIPADVLNDMRQRLYAVEDPEERRKLLAEINSQAYAGRISRLDALKTSIKSNMGIFGAKENKLIDSLLKAVGLDSYERSVFELSKGTGINLDFARFDARKFQTMLSADWSGKNYSQRIWENTEVLAGQLRDTLLKGITAGRSIDRMTKDIEDLTGAGRMQAARLIRTETTYVANASELQSYKDCGIDRYRYLATLDSRTSETCRELDGKIFKVSEGRAGVNLPPMHPYCRSTTVAWIDDSVIEGMKRRARDPETGKVDKVPAGMTYREWKKSLEGKDLGLLGLGESSGKNSEITRNDLGYIDIGKIERTVEYVLDSIRNMDVEHAVIIESDGHAIEFIGGEESVDFNNVNLENAVIIHNHPSKNHGYVSFGKDDFELLQKYPDVTIYACNEAYYYRAKVIEKIDKLSYSKLWDSAMDEMREGKEGQHVVFEELRKSGYIEYERRPVSYRV